MLQLGCRNPTSDRCIVIFERVMELALSGGFLAKIKRLGGYLEADEHGYLKKRADVSNIRGRWLEAVEATREVYVSGWGDALHSVYVRGSVANGFAVENVSDLDSFAVFREGRFDGPSAETWEERAARDLQERFPFVAGFELICAPFERAIDRENPDAFITKVESACVCGEDLAAKIEGYRPGPEMAFQTRYFRRHLDVFASEYPLESEQDQPETLAWLLRRFLRLGMELVMDREQRFTRDLYPCYQSFAKHYPQKQGEMYRALELAVNPISSPEAEDFARNFGEWLAKEADERMEEWQIFQTP